MTTPTGGASAVAGLLKMNPDTLEKAFGQVKSAQDLASEAINTFKGLCQKKTSEEAHVTFKLAPSFGNLTSEAFKAMDEQLKVTIAGTIKKLEALVKEKSVHASWDDVVAALQQNVLIEPFDLDRAVYDTYTRKSEDFFKFDGAPSGTDVEAVKTWYRGKIGDQDILDASVIDDKALTGLAKIVCETGATVTDPLNLVYKTEDEEKTILDIGVLRFPDVSNPYYKVYRIRVTAYRHCERIMMEEKNDNGLRLEFNVRKYRPRKEVLDKMKPAIVQKAVDEANDMFA